MINNRDKFDGSPPAGFDGVFNWDWTKGCFGETKIEPMDFDGVVERKGNFLVFETKNPGAPIPQGQQITLDTLWSLGCFTIMIIHGKESPENIEIWVPLNKDPERRKLNCKGLKKAREVVSKWFIWASENPR